MKYVFILASLVCFTSIGCKKDDKTPPSIPTLTTTAVSNLSGTTGQSGGVITDNGGATITTSGICWSKTNNPPTISDDTTKGTTSSGSFTAMLKNLQPSATYYVRAYAINSAGIGYGNVVAFNTGNAAPQAKNISFVGTAAVTNKIKVTYTYSDFENDAPATASYQWYIATDTSGGATGTAINSATDSIYLIAAGDQNKFLRAVITPKAAAGTTTGVATNSYWIGPVGPEPTSVIFTYNGQTVTYGIITSPTTAKKWLDRNLGATRAATAVDDYLAYGDLFQWGRPADGHQLITWASSTSGSPVNGTTTTLATTDIPGHSLFITIPAGSTVFDWRDNNNDKRWKINTQGNCPVGWHIPTREEWLAEGIGAMDAPTAFAKLKLALSGRRSRSTGNTSAAANGTAGHYWASSGNPAFPGGAWSAIIQTLSSTDENTNDLAQGKAIRCIKD